MYESWQPKGLQVGEAPFTAVRASMRRTGHTTNVYVRSLFEAYWDDTYHCSGLRKLQLCNGERYVTPRRTDEQERQRTTRRFSPSCSKFPGNWNFLEIRWQEMAGYSQIVRAQKCLRRHEETDRNAPRSYCYPSAVSSTQEGRIGH